MRENKTIVWFVISVIMQIEVCAVSYGNAVILHVIRLAIVN